MKGEMSMKEYSFKVESPMGAVRMTHYSKWTDPRAKRYAQYKRRVRLTANVAGVPQVINENERVFLTVDVSWKGAALVDLDNVVKGVADALWRQDRRVSQICAEHFEHANVEEDVATVAVTITRKVTA